MRCVVSHSAVALTRFNSPSPSYAEVTPDRRPSPTEQPLKAAAQRAADHLSAAVESKAIPFGAHAGATYADVRNVLKNIQKSGYFELLPPVALAPVPPEPAAAVSADAAVEEAAADAVEASVAEASESGSSVAAAAVADDKLVPTVEVEETDGVQASVPEVEPSSAGQAAAAVAAASSSAFPAQPNNAAVSVQQQQGKRRASE